MCSMPYYHATCSILISSHHKARHSLFCAFLCTNIDDIYSSPMFTQRKMWSQLSPHLTPDCTAHDCTTHFSRFISLQTPILTPHRTKHLSLSSRLISLQTSLQCTSHRSYLLFASCSDNAAVHVFLGWHGLLRLADQLMTSICHQCLCRGNCETSHHLISTTLCT